MHVVDGTLDCKWKWSSVAAHDTLWRPGETERDQWQQRIVNIWLQQRRAAYATAKQEADRTG